MPEELKGPRRIRAVRDRPYSRLNRLPLKRVSVEEARQTVSDEEDSSSDSSEEACLPTPPTPPRNFVWNTFHGSLGHVSFMKPYKAIYKAS